MSAFPATSSDAGPSSPRHSPPRAPVDSDGDSDEDGGYGLDDLIPEPESPLPAPYSYASFEAPEGITLPLPDGRRDLILRLVGSHPLWGHHLWNTSRSFSTYLLRHPGLVRGKRVLELGAGAGLPSLVSVLSGAEHVVMTDYPDEDLVKNMRWNMECNVGEELRGRVDVTGFLWGKDVKALLRLGQSEEGGDIETNGNYNLLILSDLVFNHSQHPALIQSVNALLSPSPTAQILVFITHHRPHLAKEDMAFFTQLCASDSRWQYEMALEEWTGVMFDEDRGDEKERGTVRGWRCWRAAA